VQRRLTTINGGRFDEKVKPSRFQVHVHSPAATAGSTVSMIGRRLRRAGLARRSRT